MLTINRYSEKTYEKSGVRPVAKTKENVAENNVFTAVFRAQENTRWTSRFSGVHRRKTPNSPDVFQRVENGWQIANFPKIPLLVKLPVNEGFLAVFGTALSLRNENVQREMLLPPSVPEWFLLNSILLKFFQVYSTTLNLNTYIPLYLQIAKANLGG